MNSIRYLGYPSGPPQLALVGVAVVSPRRLVFDPFLSLSRSSEPLLIYLLCTRDNGSHNRGTRMELVLRSYRVDRVHSAVEEPESPKVTQTPLTPNAGSTEFFSTGAFFFFHVLAPNNIACEDVRYVL